MIGNIENQDNWIIDSGSTDHMNYLTKWPKFLRKNNPSVTIPNGKLVTVDGIGDIQFIKRHQIKILLNMPYFNYNLLSISKVTRDLGCALTFLHDLCYI